jgi:hypothetical protein
VDSTVAGSEAVGSEAAVVFAEVALALTASVGTRALEVTADFAAASAFAPADRTAQAEPSAAVSDLLIEVGMAIVGGVVATGLTTALARASVWVCSAATRSAPTRMVPTLQFTAMPRLLSTARLTHMPPRSTVTMRAT